MGARSYRFRSNPPVLPLSWRKLPSRSSYQQATRLGSSFGQSMCKHPLLAYFHSRTLLSIRLHSRRYTSLHKLKSTFAILFAGLPISLVFVSGSHLQFTLAFLEVVSPFSVVYIPVRVLINSMIGSLAVPPIAFVAISVRVLNDTIPMLLVIEPLSLVFSTGTVMINSFSMFLSIQEVALIFILICIDDFSLVRGSIIDPLSIINCSGGVFEHSMAILFIFEPISDIFITVFIIIGSLAMFLVIEPVSLVLLSIGVVVDAKAVLPILMPFTVVDCSAAIIIHPSAVLLAVQKFALISFAVGIDVEPIAGELIFFPCAHVTIFIGEGVDSLATSKILVLSDVLTPVRVRNFLILASEFAIGLEKLRQKLFAHGVQIVGVASGMLGLGAAVCWDP